MRTQPDKAWLVSELRQQLGGVENPLQVIDGLRALEGQGLVRRDQMGGRWILVQGSARGNPTPDNRKAVQQPARKSPQNPLKTAFWPGLPVVQDPGLPTPGPDGFTLDPTQRPVVYAAPDARLSVAAGPGFGKTAVACARVAHLLDSGITGSRILLLSFTRTAVREMRHRIRELARGGAEVSDVKILTIDSWSWRLLIGHSVEVPATASYESSIRNTVSLLRKPTENLRNDLDNLQHVFVDEAQDLVGCRAELIAALLNTLPTTCGFTVFLDPAQAIYDWTEDEGESGVPSISFVDLLTQIPGLHTHELGYLHRTADPALRSLLLGARQLVLDPSRKMPASDLRGSLIDNAGTPQSFRVADVVPNLSEDSLLLYRRRVDVLADSAWLAGKGIQHRLRFGGLPRVVAPWIAAVLFDACKARKTHILTRADVADAWAGLGHTFLTQGWDFDRAWQVLRAMGAEGRLQVSTRRIADAVAIGNVSDEVFLKEIGPGGPILGTVHGSKGREASTVLFALPKEYLPKGEGEQVGSDEHQEARVLYVAISRAKEVLRLEQPNHAWCGYTEDGRICMAGKDNALRVEVGREGDLDLVRTLMDHPGGPAQQQSILRSYDGRIRSLTAGLKKDHGLYYWCVGNGNAAQHRSGEGAVVAVFSQAVTRAVADLSFTDKYSGNSQQLHHIYWMDLTTVALRTDDLRLPEIAEPWRSLRLLLAPVLVGLGRTIRNRKK